MREPAEAAVPQQQKVMHHWLAAFDAAEEAGCCQQQADAPAEEALQLPTGR